MTYAKEINAITRTDAVAEAGAVADAEAAIEMHSISMKFSGRTVLKDVSISIKSGEIFGLLGPSGAGKTTLLKILTGQIVPTAGESRLLGIDSRKAGVKISSSIGMVLDNSGLYSRLSCYDNLLLFARIFDVDKKRINEVLDQVKLTGDSKKPVGQLSKGMTQRLVLARAILHKPALLFLDEPTSGLDPHTAREIHKLIFSLRENGATVFLTTHNMEEAATLCDHVALLNEGIVVEHGRPDEICRKYNSQNRIFILCSDKTEVILPNNKGSAEAIGSYFKEDRVAAIHSSEPDLASVFITVAGRPLE